MADINDRQSNTFDDITDYGTVSSLSELEKRPMERKYFFDQSVGWENKIQSTQFLLLFLFCCLVILEHPHKSRSWLVSEYLLYFACFSPSPPTATSLLWLYLRARHGRDGHSYCSVKGCERVKIMATTSTKQTCNCTAKAYPKYSKTPTDVVPMPQLNTQSCKGCGAKQVCVATFKVTSAQLLKTQATTTNRCVSVSACVFQWTMDVLPPNTNQVSQQKRAAERR